MIITILSICTNGMTLTTFFTTRTLWTPFNVYVINLLVSNLLFLVLRGPINLLNNIYNRWPLSNGACTLLNFGNACLSGPIYFTHLLISLDRLWATYKPVHYRQYHNFKVSILMCVAVYLYVYANVLPVIVLEALYYRIPVETNPCYFNPSKFEFFYRIQAIQWD